MKSAFNVVAICTALVLPTVPGLTAELVPSGLSEEAVKSAETPEQDRTIADAYAREAEELRAKATAHRHMDSWYNEPGYLSHKLGFPRHCRLLTQQLEAAAKEADALAKAHRVMAEEAAKKPR